MVTKGVLYFVIGDRKGHYYDMAVRSAGGIKKYMPELETVLFTDKVGKEDRCFDEIVVTETPNMKNIWIYKYECFLNSPYEHTLHLDADTYICDGFPEVFEMLDRFDFVTCLSPHYGLNEKVKGVPTCFPEIAGGFMLWKNNYVMIELWNKIIELLPDKSWKRADEPTIRRAMYESNVRYAIVPWEYTCVYLQPGYLFGKVKIMHGKGKNIERDAEIFNQISGKRVYSGSKLFRLENIRRRYMGLNETIPYSWELDK